MIELRVLTYNVRGCVGMDGRRSLERVSRVIRDSAADVAAVQELFVVGDLGGMGDQPAEIARRLGMRCLFTATVVHRGRRYGHALFARFPIRLVRHGLLPSLPITGIEPRAALWATVRVENTDLQVLTTHLGLRRRERDAQVQALLGSEWLGGKQLEPLILCGDLNAAPGSSAYRRLTRRFADVQRARGRLRARPTWPSPLPVLRIDHMLVSRDVDIADARVPATWDARGASDHRPVVAEIILR